ncbi:MAG: AEC family transporter, partial [bacterium]|nr:AEC family transporter [bacterium]
PRTRRLFLLMTMSVSILTLQKLQPFLGNPLESVQTVKALVFFHLAFLCTVGLYLGGGRTRSVDNAYQILKNPMVYFFGIGFVLAGLGTTLPNEILEFIDSLYKVMIPLSLVVMGLMLGRYVYFFQMQEYGLLFGPLLVCIVFQLFLSPLLAWIITHMMGFEDIELQRALILSSGAPSGILAALIACVYGRSNERRFAILCVFLTTILSMATLPFWFYLLNRWLPFPTPMA